MSERLRPQDRRALIIGGIALAVLLGYSRLVKPALDGLARERRTLTEQGALLAREHALVALAPTLPRLQQEARKALTVEQTRLFAGDSVAATAELTSYVGQVATVTGVHLTTIEGRAPSASRGVTRLLVDVRGEGSWRQVLAFAHALEAAAPFVDIASIRIERGARGGPLGGDLVFLSATLAGYGRGAR